MRKALLSLALAAGQIIPVTVGYFESQIGVVPRYYAGTIEADVRRSQGEKTVESQSLASNYALLKAALENRVKRNMKTIRKHVDCVEKPETCKSVYVD